MKELLSDELWKEIEPILPPRRPQPAAGRHRREVRLLGQDRQARSGPPAGLRRHRVRGPAAARPLPAQGAAEKATVAR